MVAMQGLIRVVGIHASPGSNRYLGPSNVEVALAPTQGRSGGGLFDAENRLIGVCFAADNDYDEGLYSGPDVVYENSVDWALDTFTDASVTFWLPTLCR